jgi:predicted component of type VI protein secretion system
VRVPPAALPVKGQFVYFQLDPSNELWEGIKGAKNLAFYLPPEYPGLTLELLGLRE